MKIIFKMILYLSSISYIILNMLMDLLDSQSNFQLNSHELVSVINNIMNNKNTI